VRAPQQQGDTKQKAFEYQNFFRER
jgi:hypothetical protein